jgi:prepilin-type N-terminal cleavage/methylation domain-containing protein
MTQGFTLIECLIVIALLSFLIVWSYESASMIAASAEHITDDARTLHEEIMYARRARAEAAYLTLYP